MKKSQSSILFLIIIVLGAYSQTDNINGLTSTAFLVSSNSQNISYGVVGQPTGSGMLLGDNNTAFTEFMDSFVMFPDRDADEDGIPDESTKDNDGDSINDLTEIEGTSFSPTTPTSTQRKDTDWDGVNDDIELIAGTDPSDPTSYLKVNEINITNQEFIISWKGRANIDYQIVLYTNIVFSNDYFVSSTVSSTNGTGDWQTTWLSWTNNIDIPAKYYKIKVVQ